MTNRGPAIAQVVHLDFIALPETAPPGAVEDLIAEAANLTPIESVQTAGVIRAGAGSDFDLAFFFVLDGFTSLEPFGTDPRYIRFLQGKVARSLRAFAGADVALDAPFPEVAPFAACLALMAPEQTYDWEVRAALEDWAEALEPRADASGGANAGPSAAPQSVVGLAIGERQRYRGCVLSFKTAEITAERLAGRRLESTLIAGRAIRL